MIPTDFVHCCVSKWPRCWWDIKHKQTSDYLPKQSKTLKMKYFWKHRPWLAVDVPWWYFWFCRRHSSDSRQLATKPTMSRGWCVITLLVTLSRTSRNPSGTLRGARMVAPPAAMMEICPAIHGPVTWSL